ncbi:hypothetical protein H6776_02950 [Candidatus Nomurabacteria bacterium]|nr:hypothetical protein [Candidatus Nomurabacteria bacterium]
MFGGAAVSTIALLWKIGFILIPLITIPIAFHLWLLYNRRRTIAEMDWIVLQIIPPQEVHRSPVAMELVLNAMTDTGGTQTWYRRWVQGKVRSWYSLEITSIEGSIYFFVRAERKFKDFITSQFYSQYPNAQIREVDDYTRYIPVYQRGGDWDMLGFEMAPLAPSVYPIKSYVDYGMEESLGADPEQRIDPMSPILEALSIFGKHEQAWIQFIFRPAVKKRDPHAPWWTFGLKKRSWDKEAEEEMDKFQIDSMKKNMKVLQAVDPNRQWATVSLTDGQKTVLKALGRNSSKQPYDFAGRVLYLAKKGYMKGERFGMLINMFRAFGGDGLNGFKPNNDTSAKYPWDDPTGNRVETWKEEMFYEYVNRMWFHVRRRTFSDRKDSRKDTVLTSEEIASLWHLPSTTVTSPTLERVGSITAQAPGNLPMGE